MMDFFRERLNEKRLLVSTTWSDPTVAPILLSQRGCGASTLCVNLLDHPGLAVARFSRMTSGGVKTSANALKRLAVAMMLDPFGDDLEQRLAQSIRSLGRCQVKTLWLIDRCDRATAQAAARLAELTSSLAAVMATSVEAAGELQDTVDFCPLRSIWIRSARRHHGLCATRSGCGWRESSIVRRSRSGTTA